MQQIDHTNNFNPISMMHTTNAVDARTALLPCTLTDDVEIQAMNN